MNEKATPGSGPTTITAEPPAEADKPEIQIETTTAAPPPGDAPPTTSRGWPARGGAILLFSALSVAAVVAMNEVDKIIGSVQIGTASHGAAALFAPFVSHEKVVTTFQDWSLASCLVPIQNWLSIYLAVDLVFILGYVLVLAGAHLRWNLVGSGWLILLAADVAEDALAGVAATALPGSGSGWVHGQRSDPGLLVLGMGADGRDMAEMDRGRRRVAVGDLCGGRPTAFPADRPPIGNRLQDAAIQSDRSRPAERPDDCARKGHLRSGFGYRAVLVADRPAGDRRDPPGVRSGRVRAAGGPAAASQQAARGAGTGRVRR